MDVLGLVPDAGRGWDLRFDNNEDMPFEPCFFWVLVENTAEDEITWQYLLGDLGSLIVCRFAIALIVVSASCNGKPSLLHLM